VKSWFTPQKTVYGMSYLLRALIELGAWGHWPRSPDYVAEVAEALLRHVGVRRQQAFPFRPEGLPYDAVPRLERLRWTLALLDAGRFFRDARFLNAALKLNDWHYRAVRAVRANADRMSRSGAGAPVGLHYVACVAGQERL